MSNPEQTLQSLRQQINAIDEQIIKLINQRGNVSLKLIKVKRAIDPSLQNIRDRDRELEILNRITSNNRGPFSNAQLTLIYELIFKIHRALQQDVKDD